MKVNKKFGDKICKKCGIKKPISDFRKHPPNKLGRSWVDGSCKDCVRKYKRETRAKWRANNLEKSRKQLKNWSLIRTYGITLDDYNKMFDEQQECCAICRVHNSKLNKPLAVDHSHKSGNIRKLLCAKCNTGLGMFQDNKNLLSLAINYLESCNDY